MTVHTSVSDSPRTFDVRVSYIGCASPVRAPEGCLQYFTGAAGQFSTYGFQSGVQPDAQRYSFCFRKEDGTERREGKGDRESDGTFSMLRIIQHVITGYRTLTAHFLLWKMTESPVGKSASTEERVLILFFFSGFCSYQIHESGDAKAFDLTRDPTDITAVTDVSNEQYSRKCTKLLLCTIPSPSRCGNSAYILLKHV